MNGKKFKEFIANLNIDDDDEVCICPVPSISNFVYNISPTIGKSKQNEKNVLVLGLEEWTCYEDEIDIKWKRKSD